MAMFDNILLGLFSRIPVRVVPQGWTLEWPILDLCAGSGAWSKPYRDAGYRVHCIDLPQDVRLLEYPGKVHGILAAPPCTVFAASGFRWKRTEDELRNGLSIVDACLRLVSLCEPEWWALENPTGRLGKWLGPPALSFDPYEYGNPWPKRTHIWGHFTVPVKAPVSVEIAPGWRVEDAPGQGAGSHDTRSADRAVTPSGFAEAFFRANP